MKKFFLALGALAIVGAGAYGATSAFFSDQEASVGNTFTAGAVDIAIADVSHDYESDGEVNPQPKPVFTDNGTTFTLADLKPGDTGTVSYTLNNNENAAYVCAAASEGENAENTRLEQEFDSGDNSTQIGELQNFLEFKFGNATGTLSDISGEFQGDADEVDSNGSTDSEIEYCFGTFSSNGTCDGSSDDNNVAQTDSVDVDLTFEAVQQRNNPNFSCDDLNEDNTRTYNEISRVDENGDVEETFNTIQAAIDDGDELGGGDGSTDDDDTIVVPDGTYNEDVTIDKELTIKGAGDDSTTIIGQSSSKGAVHVVNVNGNTVSNVIFSGFRVEQGGASSAAFNVETGGNNAGTNDNITVKDNTFVSANGGHAVYAGSITNSSFENNLFTIASGDEPTILVYVDQNGSDNVDFIDNTFTGALGSNLALGVKADNGEFSGNDLTGITASGKDKLVDYIGYTADASNGGNSYPTGDGWHTVNGGASDFKGVYRNGKESNVANGSDTVTQVN